jgi:hypothetical protein
MRLSTMFGAIILFGCAAALPLSGHECNHNGHHRSTDCVDCGNCTNCGQNSARAGRHSAAPGGQTWDGRVAEVIYLTGPTPSSGMVELRLQTGGAEKLVRLAPAGFLKGAGLQLKEGFPVTIKGMAVTGMEGDLILATEVVAAGKTVTLRDSRGRPVW